MNSVVAVVHNVPSRTSEIYGFTKPCIETLRATADEDFELILIDNGSKDWPQTFQLLTDLVGSADGYQKGSVVLRFDENEPVAHCWNTAIEKSSSEIILLINNDVIFHRQGWMQELTSPLYQPSVGASGGKMMSWNGFSFLEGAFLAFRKEVALGIAEGGKVFDERFQFTCEEADFCTRLQRVGKSLVETRIEIGGYATHLHHGTLCWMNEDGGESIHAIMHESRLKLCRKYGRADRVDD